MLQHGIWPVDPETEIMALEIEEILESKLVLKRPGFNEQLSVWASVDCLTDFDRRTVGDGLSEHGPLNPEKDLVNFVTIHHEMGHIQYYQQYNAQVLFFGPYNIAYFVWSI